VSLAALFNLALLQRVPRRVECSEKRHRDFPFDVQKWEWMMADCSTSTVDSLQVPVDILYGLVGVFRGFFFPKTNTLPTSRPTVPVRLFYMKKYFVNMTHKWPLHNPYPPELRPIVLRRAYL
jgi:hypothetical protein